MFKNLCLYTAFCCFALFCLNNAAQAEATIQPDGMFTPVERGTPPANQPAVATPEPLSKAPAPEGPEGVVASNTNGWQVVSPGYGVSLNIPPDWNAARREIPVQWGRLFEYAAPDGSQKALVSIIINGPEMRKNMAWAHEKMLHGEWWPAPESRALRIDGCNAFYARGVADSGRPYRLILALMHDYTVVLTLSDAPDAQDPFTAASNGQAMLESLHLKKDYRIYPWLFRADERRLHPTKDGRYDLGYGFSVGRISDLNDYTMESSVAVQALGFYDTRFLTYHRQEFVVSAGARSENDKALIQKLGLWRFMQKNTDEEIIKKIAGNYYPPLPPNRVKVVADSIIRHNNGPAVSIEFRGTLQMDGILAYVLYYNTNGTSDYGVNVSYRSDVMPIRFALPEHRTSELSAVGGTGRWDHYIDPLVDGWEFTPVPTYVNDCGFFVPRAWDGVAPAGAQ